MPDFKPMLAKDGDPSVLSYPVVVQPKLDGIRASVVNGRLLTRTLKEVPNREVYEALSRPEFEGLDGELIVGDVTADDAYRQTTSFVMAPNKTGEPWAFHVFDKWDVKGGYWLRWDEACKLVLSHIQDAPFVLVQTQTILNAPALEAYEAARIGEGHEGVIVRDPDAPYKFGRSGKKGPLLKVKRFVDFEATVIGVYEELHNANEAKTNALGRTERSSAAAGRIGKGTLGGLVLVGLNGPAQGVEFRCGTGFNAADREALWAMSKLNGTSAGLTGHVAKIKSFPIGVKDKPRHPVFLGWRDAADFGEAA